MAVSEPAGGEAPLDGPGLRAACSQVQLAIRAFNRCLARLPALPPDAVDDLKATAQAAGDLHGLLTATLAQLLDVRAWEDDGWLVVDPEGSLEPSLPTGLPWQPATPPPPPPPPPPAVTSAYDIVWRGRARSAEEDGVTGDPSPDPLGSSFEGPRRPLSLVGSSALYTELGEADLEADGVAASEGNEGSGPPGLHDRCPDGQALLALFANQGALVKTIKNDGWPSFLEKLLLGVRTSTSLPPPGGRNMRLFGTETAHSAGLVWDRQKLDLRGCWAWPSGYYAKTEFNVDARGRLKNGRQEALVLVDDLVAANATFTSQHSYNEVFCEVGPAALVAVFCRTLQLRHLVFGMGVRDHVAAVVGRRLPIVVLHPELGVRLVTDHHQLQVVRACIAEAKAIPPLAPGTTAFVDLSNLPSVTPEDVVTFHGLYGCTDRTLHACLLPALTDREGLLLRGLETALAVDNGAAATQLVKQVFPLVMRSLTLANLAPNIQALCLQAVSKEALVASGALTALCGFRSGRCATRIAEACGVLEEWVTRSASLSFRIQSWKELHEKHGDDPNMAASLLPFLGQRAVANRTAFLHALRTDLATAQNAVQFFMRLCALLAPLHHPCLRLELLQYITGTHSRFSVATLRRTAEFAFECLAEDSSRDVAG